MIFEVLPATLLLAAAGLVIEIVLGSALGLWDGLRDAGRAAWRR